MVYFHISLIVVGLICGFRYRVALYIPVLVVGLLVSIGICFYDKPTVTQALVTVVAVQLDLQCGYFFGVTLRTLTAIFRGKRSKD